MYWCDVCMTYHGMADRCYPEYRCEFAGDDADYHASEEIRAASAAEAARRYAESTDAASAEYSIARGNPAVVIVRDESGRVRKFRVSGAARPEYEAEPLEDVEVSP